MEPDPAAGAAARGESVARPASRVSLATAASRVAGLAREMVFAALVGDGREASAFVIAFRIPNLLRDFFAEGALSSAFVPTFATTRRREGDARAFALARRVLGTLGVVTGVVAVLGILFTPAVVSVIAWDAKPETFDLTVVLTRIMFPFLPLVALAAVAMGVLNTYRYFFVPALAPTFFNVVAILGGLGMLAAGWGGEGNAVRAVTVWAVLVLVGGAAQLLAQVPLLRRVGWRGPPTVDLRFADPGLRTVTRRMAPVLISLAGTNVMLVIVTALAAQDDNWPAWLGFAFRLVHLPIGIVGVALGTVLLALGAHRGAAGDQAGLDDMVRRGLRLNWFLALPAAVGLGVLAEPLIRMIYERGNFGAVGTAQTAAALRYYAVGIVFYAGVKAAAPLFLAHGNTRTPMVCSLAGIAVTIALAFALVGPLGHRGLALAVALGSTTNYLALRALGRRAYGRGSGPGLPFLARVGAAAVLMGLLGHLAASAWLAGDGAATSGWLHALATLGLTAGLGAFYFLVTSILGLEETAWIRRRLGR